jgi:predicted nucleotidyltransferase
MMILSPTETSEILHLVWSVRPDARVWAFGSRARNKHRNDSDLDLYLEGDSEFTHKDISLIRDRLKQSSVSFDIDVICAENTSPEILKNIQKTIIPIHIHSK